MPGEGFKTTVNKVRHTMRQIAAAAADPNLDAVLRMDKLNTLLADQMKELEGIAPEQWQQHREEMISLMADLTTMTENLSQRQDTLREQMTQISKRIKAQSSYGSK